MRTSAHICTHMHTYAHICTHMHTYARTCTHMYTYAHVCAHTYAHICTHMHVKVTSKGNWTRLANVGQLQTRASCSQICTHMHTYTHICTHMYTYVHICTHMHMHVGMQRSSAPCIYTCTRWIYACIDRSVRALNWEKYSPFHSNKIIKSATTL